MNRIAKISVSLVIAIPLLQSVGSAQNVSDVAKVIVPFVEKHCVNCHGEKKQKGEVTLHVFKDEASILKARKMWVRVLDQLHAGEMPPEGKPRPAFDEAERFVKAVHGVFERFDRTAKRDPGEVTIRRLNRVEYANTVRDLVGVTIPLGDDFPNDNVGYGFDNIGDILSLSPLQFERYLASAEVIVRTAIVFGEPPAPPNSFSNAHQGWVWPDYGPRYDRIGRLSRDAQGKEIPEKERLPRGVGDGWRIFYGKGPFQKQFTDLINPGEYQITAKMVGIKAGDELPKFALVVNGKSVTEGVCGEKDEDYVASVRLKPGELNIGVSLLNPFTEPADETKKRGIALGGIKIVGPMFPESHERLLAGSEKLEGDAKSRFVLERFATRAYRRPATKEEVDRLIALMKQAEQIPWFKLTETSVKKLREAKVEGHWIKKLEPLLSAEFRDDEYFGKSVRALLIVNGKPDDTHLKAVLAAAEQAPPSWEARIALAMRAVLASPKFLYRAELNSRPTEKEAHPIDDFQLASRLSYFLWSTMPDQELFDLAAKKQLHQTLPAQVKRMLADPRSKALFDNFATQWLHLRKLREFSPDPKLFPEFTLELRDDMLRETDHFFMAVVREDRSILDLIDGKFTYLNQRLAKLYDIGDTNGNSSLPKVQMVNPKGDAIPQITAENDSMVGRNPFVRVNLENTRRGGLLTHASVLAITSQPTRTSPVKRGHWVLERILGTPPPPPPPNVPPLEGKKEAKPATLRQQLEQHRANPDCTGCHARMDPIGFGFENFNAIGRFRDKDGDLPIDAAGELPGGQKFNGPDELKIILKNKKELFSRNLTEKMLIYAAGRGLDFYDRRSVDGILAELQKNDNRFHSLITAIVQSDPFRMRRGKDQP